MKTKFRKFKYFSQYTLFQIITLYFSLNIQAQDRAVWATAWDITTPEKIDMMLTNLHAYGFNKLFIQTRYRGDALYTPNKTDSSYLNPEPRCYLLAGTNFDPLQYTIEKAKPLGIGVYAWVTTFVITPHDLRKIDSSHVYYQHPEWLLSDRYGKKSAYNEYEGAFIDPSLPEVRFYTLNVLSDIVANYDIAGIQLDYIRYPDSMFGWNRFNQHLQGDTANFDFTDWKQQKISSFMNLVYISLKGIKPGLEVSAAVIADKNRAQQRYSQYWWNWLRDGHIDRVYVMAYNTSNKSFSENIKRLKTYPHPEKMTIIVRSWQEGQAYHVSQINNKLQILKTNGFINIGYYNYTGLIEQKYLYHIRF